MTMNAQAWFPGDFQTACSEIFGGSCQGIFAHKPDWATEFVSDSGMDPEAARKTFKIGLAAQSSDEMSKTYMEQNSSVGVSITKVYNVGLEVTELVPASKEIKKFYDDHPAAKGLKSLGRLKAKTWHPPHALPQDLTEEEKQHEAESKRVTEAYEFFMEDHVLKTCFVGMKFEATVRELSFGLKFFDAISGVFCSFYEILPNELMIGWKKPEDEPLPMRKKDTLMMESPDSPEVLEEGLEDNEDHELGWKDAAGEIDEI